jgi:two-component system response regulator YesN
MNHTITVIIADDESAIRNGLVDIVSVNPFDAVVLKTAENGKEALSLIKEYKPDISIIDINMPEMNGLEVIRHTIESNCETNFIIISGYNDFTYAQKAIRYGVKSYFLKPLNIMEFKEEFAKQCQDILKKRGTLQNFSKQKLNSLVESSRILFLNQLIQNRLQNQDDLTTKLSLINLNISNTESFVVLFQINDDKVLKLSEINYHYIKNYFNSYNMESWVYNENQIVAIFNFNDNNDVGFRSNLQSCIDRIKENTLYRPKVGIGTIVTNLSQCFQSYALAQEALTYHIYESTSDVFDNSFICGEKPSFSKENIDFNPIIKSIIKNDIPGIADYINAFFNSLFFIKMPPPNFIVGMCMYLIMNVQKQITLQYPDKNIEFEFNFDEIIRFESIEVLQKWLNDFFVRYSDMLKDTAGDSNSIIRISKEYIQNNLHRNIKTKDVAAQVNLSETYFSIYFKDKTGINFRDYLLTAKINHAKTLLKSKETSISEIAYVIGYQDYRSFSRAFKKETGLSPSEYSNSIDVTIQSPRF